MIHVLVPDTQRDAAREAAEGIADLLGERAEPWRIELTEPIGAKGWLVQVQGEGRHWVLLFEGPEAANPKVVVDQFRLNLRPYLAALTDVM
jgi:hypothetical protein